MNKKIKKYLVFLVVIALLCSAFFITKKNENEKNEIAYFSPEAAEKYFEEISKVDSDEEKENMLIVFSDKGIADSYGAMNIIEAPNNQYILQYASVEEKESALQKLKEDERIENVEENGYYVADKVNYDSWGIEKMALDEAISFANTYSSNMKQVTVAIIDTGCDMSLFNKYYAGKISEYYNVLEHSTTVMADEEGHGTHIAGTIAEGTPNNVKILPIKVSKTGTMYYTDIIAAINYVVQNNKAQVINMSFGGYSYNEALDQAIEAANKKNIISVAAAGNGNTSSKHYPSALSNTISIAAVDSDLNRSTFSNYGSEITFTAPGTNIKSIMGKNAAIAVGNGNNADDDHEIISGTSMATPHAVSAIAILKGYNKNLTLENVVDILKESAIDLGEEGWDEFYGNGLISFKDVQFCDGTYCDELGVYKDLNKSISSITAVDTNITQYNYYSVTNLMGIKVNVSYADGTSETLTVGELPNVSIENYDPLATGTQTVTINVGSVTNSIQVTNPSNYESGWTYNVTSSGKIEITGYKNHNLKIERLYVPNQIASKQVVAFADNFKFAESGNDIDSYVYLHLPASFKRIGNYSLANTKIKYVYAPENGGIEVGEHAFENSEIVLIDAPIVKVEDYGFKDCYELASIDLSGNFAYTSASNTKIGEVSIGDYAFYNCKKLAKITNLLYDTVFVNELGDYAFYNCVVLAKFDLRPSTDIGEYAFYNTFLLLDVDLYNSDSIGRYAFYGSGITEANFSVSFDVINESAFENCKNLKELSFNGGTIESKAFWNSGVEKIFLGSVEYIAENAFAYSPVKSANGIVSLNGPYQVVSNLGIVENGNKLLVGFTAAIGASNTVIPENITEIGNYAFTGNNTLKKIVIPANVTKIGTHAFEDCYQLADVYMLGNTINFGSSSFKRNYEGEIQEADFKMYVYKNSQIKTLAKNSNLNYRHIEPDEIVVTNYNSTYAVGGNVDISDLNVKLIYHEEEYREEDLEPMNFGTVTPLSTGVGFYIVYQSENGYNFHEGDTYFIVQAKNSVGYSITKNVPVAVSVPVEDTYTIDTTIIGSAEVSYKINNGTFGELPDSLNAGDNVEVLVEYNTSEWEFVGVYVDGERIPECITDDESQFCSFEMPAKNVELRIELNEIVNSIPVYRLYNPYNAEHLYTTDANEVEVLYTEHGWGKEGIGWYSLNEGTPVYRLYNPGLGNHLYTSNMEEISILVENYGWVKDNNGKPVMYSTGNKNDIPIYRVYNENLSGMHHLTTDLNEYNILPQYGWKQEGVSMYAVKIGVPETTHYYNK